MNRRCRFAPVGIERAAQGFTIVELMVAMVLALIIIAAVGALYVTSKQSFRVQDNASGIDETMRALEEDISREARKAGFFGCFRWKPKLAGPGNAYALTAVTPLSFGNKFPIPMVSPGVPKLGPNYDVAGGTASTTTVSPLQSTVTIVPGSEFLSISYGQPLAYLASKMSNGKAALQLNHTISLSGDAGKPLLVSNCDALTLLRASETGTRSLIDHHPGNFENLSLGDENWAYAKFDAGAVLMSLQSSVFFLGQKAGDPPTLYLLSPDNQSGQAEPLAANVEQLNLLYGVDTGAATLTFMNAAAVAALEAAVAESGWLMVRAVKVGFVLRSDADSVSGTAANAGIKFTWNAATGNYDKTSTATDSRLRKAHVFTVAIRGRSPSF